MFLRYFPRENTVFNGGICPMNASTVFLDRILHLWLVLSLRTNFFVNMSGQISSRRWQLSTKQRSGNKCSDVLTKIQTSSYARDHWDWPGKQWWAERQSCHCTRLTARFLQTVKPFWRLILSIFYILNVSFLFQNSHYYVNKTESLSSYTLAVGKFPVSHGIPQIPTGDIMSRQFCGNMKISVIILGDNHVPW